VVIATGAKPRKLTDIPETLQLEGRGVSYCATCDGNFFRGQDVVINGGGDTAAADALYLARICTQVHLVHRRDQLRANPFYATKLAEAENVTIHWNSVVAGVEETDGRVSAVRIKDVNTGEETTIPAAALFVAIRTQPDTDWLPEGIQRNEGGYVIADEHGNSSMEGVFVAGDVRAGAFRQVVTAASDGAQAAESALNFLTHH